MVQRKFAILSQGEDDLVSDREPSKEDYDRAISSTLSRYPALIDYYI